jgi:hypothetical protein
MNRFGDWKETCGENIAYGSVDATDILISLFVDDGVPGRGHRTNILNPAFKVAGAFFTKHKTIRTVCVVNYAGGFVAKTEENKSPVRTKKVGKARIGQSTKGLTKVAPKLLDDGEWPARAVSLSTQVKTLKADSGMKVTILKTYTFTDGSTKFSEKTTTVAL